MKRKPQMVYQHPPVVTPEHWHGDERQFALSLTELMDDLYNKIGQLQKRVKELEGKSNA